MVADHTRQLDPRYIRVERIAGHITTASLSLAALVTILVLSVFGAIATTVLLILIGTWASATAGFVWLSHRWPEYEYRHKAYALGDDEMEIRTGVLWQHVVTVPRSRVQHTDVAQGPIERRYGLATLVIHTAGTVHARVAVEGLAHDTALQIRDRLLPRERADAV